MNEPTPASRNTLYRRLTRSNRRLTPPRLALYRIGARIAELVIRLWWAMTRVERVLGDEHLAAALGAHGAVIPVYWHRHQLLPVQYLLAHRDRGLRLGFLVSPSVDGEMPAMLVRRTGGHAIRGSANQTGARALRDFYEAITREGVSPALTPDGPRGPADEFKPGAILLSQLSGKPMVPMAFAARHAYVFRTWDRFVLPLPFTRAVLAVGAPRIAPKRLDAAGLAAWQRDMAAELDRLEQEARKALSMETCA
ncbi:MAG: DUF374 domain-containing protein [Gammaproteobacteria bacterium]|nr:DUF374 domain-containing protein [Gammaproteobacteria bacterium]